MIEKLKWHDAKIIKPAHESTVLLWMRSAKPFSTPWWNIGWWDGADWWLSDTAEKCAYIVLHWAEPNGPDA